MIKEKLQRLLGFVPKTQDAVGTQTSVDTFASDICIADLRRVYSSGVSTMELNRKRRRGDAVS